MFTRPNRTRPRPILAVAAVLLFVSSPAAAATAQQQASPLPSGKLVFGAFEAEFAGDGSFLIETTADDGWPPMAGTWEATGALLLLSLAEAGDAEACTEAGRYQFAVDDGRLRLSMAGHDQCNDRRWMLHDTVWRPAGEPEEIPERRIQHTVADRSSPLPDPGTPEGSWPSFRGPRSSGVAAGNHDLPDTWNGETGANILWRTPIPGLAHSSPVVWGDRVFVTSAISSDANASFQAGLFGDGDASEDRSFHRWVVYALDKQTGEILWERVAYEGEPIEKRHTKSTYASATPATDGRIVVASFGSQGLHAYTVDGDHLWSVDVGHVSLGAYNLPSLEWGPASSPIIWNGTVFVQYDTHQDSFLLALDAESSELLWKVDRRELPSWGTPNVWDVGSEPELVTNASNFIRGYDPATGRELWRLGRSSMITTPTPIFGDDLMVITSGRNQQPLYVVRAGARGDITLEEGETSNEQVVWSRERRGPYISTPLIYDGILFTLSNRGVIAAYELADGEEIFRARAPHLGSGFSASPVVADGKLYLPSEDGEIFVIEAGREFVHIATNTMGELLMATPAISEGVMYVRGAQSLFAIGR